METEFLRREGRYNVYRFTCDHCGIYGEAHIPVDSRVLFDHGCGSKVLLIQKSATDMFGKPWLEEITIQSGGIA